ncbi:MAG: hypothetical protein AUI83_27765 [Armatimonadetes bacterium 13_1_40CM_3_65_7]|nr:MAG: hypothetical protein AUI83_27765 [Armatimonadetes bacterium 13_1_40CM_3_65_7]
MKETKGLTVEEKRFLAGLIRQVWRGCQGFVTLVMERGRGEAVYALEELVEWSTAQSERLRSRSIRFQMVGLGARGIASELLDDVVTFCNGIGDMLGNAQQSELDPDEVEDEALTMVDGFLAWTTMMAQQLGISRNLRPQPLWNER